MMRNRLTILVVAVAILPLPALAAAPSTRPSTNSPRGRQALMRSENREAMWQDAYRFFKEHSPLRAAAFDGMTEEGKREFKPMILGRYLAYRSLANDGGNLQQLKLDQMTLEDEIYGLRTQLAAAEANQSADPESIKAQIRKSVARLVDLRMDERKSRIGRMEKLLDEERAALERDERHRDEIIKRQCDRVLSAKGAGHIGEGRRRRSGDTDRPNRRDRESAR